MFLKFVPSNTPHFTTPKPQSFYTYETLLTLARYPTVERCTGAPVSVSLPSSPSQNTHYTAVSLCPTTRGGTITKDFNTVPGLISHKQKLNSPASSALGARCSSFSSLAMAVAGTASDVHNGKLRTLFFCGYKEDIAPVLFVFLDGGFVCLTNTTFTAVE